MRASPLRGNAEVAKGLTQKEAGRVEHAQMECGGGLTQRLCGRGGGTKNAYPDGEPPHPLRPQGAPWRRSGGGVGGGNPFGEGVQYSQHVSLPCPGSGGALVCSAVTWTG